MKVLRLIQKDSDLPLDISLSDVVEISAESRSASDGEAAVIVEADNSPRDNYRYLASSVKVVDRNPDSFVPLHEK